jgi:hypothetical protein
MLLPSKWSSDNVLLSPFGRDWTDQMFGNRYLESFLFLDRTDYMLGILDLESCLSHPKFLFSPLHRHTHSVLRLVSDHG